MHSRSDVPGWRIVRQQTAALVMLVVIAPAHGTAETSCSGQLTTGTSATPRASRRSTELHLRSISSRQTSSRRCLKRCGSGPCVSSPVRAARRLPWRVRLLSVGRRRARRDSRDARAPRHWGMASNRNRVERHRRDGAGREWSGRYGRSTARHPANPFPHVRATRRSVPRL